MDKQLKKMKREIEQRKKIELKSSRQPFEADVKYSENLKSNTLYKLFFASLCLLLITIIVQSSHVYLSSPKQWLHQQMTEAFPFASIHVWYNDKIGLPFSMTDQSKSVEQSNEAYLPVSNYHNKTILANGQGLLIETEDHDLDVFSVKHGTVLFVGNQSAIDQTIIIQHPDRSQTTYGLLDEIDVLPFQFVQAGEKIGTINHQDQRLYLRMQKGDQYLDPTEVIDVWK